MAEKLIRIGARADGGYPVELLELLADGTTAKRAAGTIPANAIDLQEAADILVGNTPATGLPAAGEKLFTALFSALGAPLQQLLDGAETTLFFDLEPNELQKVPWEILVWPKTIAGGVAPARVAAAHHLTRVYRPDWSLAGPPPSGPLRVLIVVGADPEDPDVLPGQEIEEIQRNIHSVHRTVDLDVVEDYSKLYDAIKLRRPHVLHFIGHARADPPALEFAKKGQLGAWDWEAQQIATDVGRTALDDWRPHLAFLNACRTGSAAGKLGPLAGAFLEAGTLATIAMQGNIKGAAAGRLAGVFYQSLAAGLPIDQALSKARAEVGRTVDNREASYAALTLRCHPSCLFPQFATRIDNYQARARTCPLLPKLSVFVDQLKPRRQLCGRLWPFKAGEQRDNFILIRGESGFGKTVLSTWLLDLSANLGHRVRYIQVGASPSGMDYVKILQLIWEGERPELAAVSPLLEPLPFPPGPVANLRQLLATSKDPDILYTAFRQALSDLAQIVPITLVLDGFEKRMDEGSFWVLWEHLFVPLHRAFANVNVILVLSEDEYKFYKIEETLVQRWELRVVRDDVTLEELTQEEFVNLFIEYLYYRSPLFHDNLEKIKTFMTIAKLPTPLSIARLEEKAVDLARVLGPDPLEPLKV